MQEISTFVILKATSTDRQTRRLHIFKTFCIYLASDNTVIILVYSDQMTLKPEPKNCALGLPVTEHASPRLSPLRDVSRGGSSSRNVPQRRWARTNVCRSQATTSEYFKKEVHCLFVWNFAESRHWSQEEEVNKPKIQYLLNKYLLPNLISTAMFEKYHF